MSISGLRKIINIVRPNQRALLQLKQRNNKLLMGDIQIRPGIYGIRQAVNLYNTLGHDLKVKEVKRAVRILGNPKVIEGLHLYNREFDMALITPEFTRKGIKKPLDILNWLGFSRRIIDQASRFEAAEGEKIPAEEVLEDVKRFRGWLEKELTAEFMAKEPDLERVKRVLEEALLELGVDRCRICTYDEKTEVMEGFLEIGMKYPTRFRNGARAEGIKEEAIKRFRQRGESYWCINIEEILNTVKTRKGKAVSEEFPFINIESLLKDLDEFGRDKVKWLAFLTSSIGGKIIVMEFNTWDTGRPITWDSAKYEKTMAFAILATITLSQSRLYNRILRHNKELAALYQVGTQISRVLELDELLNQTVRIISETFGYEHCAILLADKNLEILTPIAHTGYPEQLGEMKIKIAADKGFTALVARTKEPLIVGDVREDPRYISFDPEILSELAVPIKIGEKLIGVLNVESHFKDAFTQSDLVLLQQLANQLALAIENASLFEELKEQKGLAEALLKASEKIAMGLEPKTKLQAIVDSLVGLVPRVEASAIKLFDLQENQLITTASSGLSPAYIAKSSRLKPGEGISGCTFQDRKPILVADLKTDPRAKKSVAAEEGFRSMVSVPLIIGEKVVGVINIYNKNSQLFSEKDFNALTIFANQAALTLENAQLYKQVEELSITDELTGLYNRREFWRILKDEIKRSKRIPRYTSLLYIDIDDFKRVNDTYGHLNGDQVLRELAQIIKRIIRDTDIAARYGGEEFCVILMETFKEGGLTFAKRLREGIENHSFMINENKIKITVSIGVAEFLVDAHDQEAEDLVVKADLAQFFAKSIGKNQVQSYTPNLESMESIRVMAEKDRQKDQP